MSGSPADPAIPAGSGDLFSIVTGIGRMNGQDTTRTSTATDGRASEKGSHEENDDEHRMRRVRKRTKTSDMVRARA